MDPDKGFSGLSERKKNKNKKCLVAQVGRREKINALFGEFYLFLDVFNMFLAEKYILSGKIYVMSEEKIKKKLNGQYFFLVGPNSISSEESSTVEYSVCALSDNMQ